MLSRKEKFSKQDFSLIKGIKSRKIPSKIGVFCVYERAVLASALGQNRPRPLSTLIVSKKVGKTAVMRNKLKRLFYNTLKTFFKTNSNPRSKSLIFYANRVFTKGELGEVLKIIYLD